MGEDEGETKSGHNDGRRQEVAEVDVASDPVPGRRERQRSAAGRGPSGQERRRREQLSDFKLDVRVVLWREVIRSCTSRTDGVRQRGKEEGDG